MQPRNVLFLCLAAASTAGAGPLDFGNKEFASALAERNIPASRFRLQTEVSTEPPESFRIAGVRISGGDLRGLMYGLLEAAEQIRSTGRLAPAKGAAAMPVRGVRLSLDAGALENGWFHSRAYWEAMLAMLARSRLNRLNLALDGSVVVNGRLQETVRLISDVAASYAVDLVLSVRPESLNAGGGGLKTLLSGSPAVRGVQVSGPAPGRLDAIRAVGEAGRRVVAEVLEDELTPAILGELAGTGAPWMLVAQYQGQAPPALKGAQALVWRLTPPAAAADWSGPVFVRKTVQELPGPGVAGFEIEAPLRASPAADRLFYLLWGRLGYDPKTPERVWGGKAAK